MYCDGNLNILVSLNFFLKYVFSSHHTFRTINHLTVSNGTQIISTNSADVFAYVNHKQCLSCNSPKYCYISSKTHIRLFYPFFKKYQSWLNCHRFMIRERYLLYMFFFNLCTVYYNTCINFKKKFSFYVYICLFTYLFLSLLSFFLIPYI